MGVSFSDGSTLRLQPGADMRVRSLHESGAVLRLDHGGVDVDIVPRSSSAWRIDAGPYRVEVTGTAFFVAWEPASQTFEVRMERGTVEVFGPQLPGARVLEAGDHLVVLGRGPPPALGVEEPPSTVAGNDGDDDRRGEEPEATTPTSAGAETTRASPPTRAQSGPQSEVSWRDLARRRHYAEAIARAEASGFSKLCDTLPSDALLELADAARYARRATLARHALVTLRRRFAGTADAAAAAFDLGRLASGDCTDGLAWFRTYLDERPRGSMAPEAKRRIGQCEDRQTTTADRH
jgi:hypothetical protein